MKTRLSLLALSTALSTLWLPALQAQADTARIGVAAAVRNQVTASQASQDRPLVVGAGIFQDETIRTGVNSVAQLLFADQTTLSVGPRSEVRLDRYVYDPHQSVGDVAISLSTGALRFITGSQDPHSYSIRTPVATIGVRGTIVDFLFINGRAFAILDEGRAQFTLENGRVVELNEPGTALEFFSDGTSSPPMTWRGRYEAGQRATSFPLYGNAFADMPEREGGDTNDHSNHTDELQARNTTPPSPPVTPPPPPPPPVSPPPPPPPPPP
ncbi:MAG: FecR domain-containing protein, partial [Proteobacteria bacterium]|nr:FecR domain-containing protein [Pseudomonadota bacterium]